MIQSTMMIRDVILDDKVMRFHYQWTDRMAGVPDEMCELAMLEHKNSEEGSESHCSVCSR